MKRLMLFIILFSLLSLFSNCRLENIIIERVMDVDQEDVSIVIDIQEIDSADKYDDSMEYLDANSSDGEDVGCKLKLLSGVVQISAGGTHTCALMEYGGVKCWGDNIYGQLGDGSTENRITPVNVSGLSSGVKRISSGGIHSCALLDNGVAKCWGNNEYGQLGDGTTENRLLPVDVVGLSSGVKEISAGYYHTCALMETDGVKCWGDNEFAQLGDGTTKERLKPVDVVGLNSNIQKIAAGGHHTCALMTDGTVKCWGYNEYGQLGDGTKENRSTPIDVYGLPAKVKDISAGAYHTCAVLIDGRVMCWGRNDHCQLGNGSTEESHKPVFVLDLDNDVLQVDAGYDHTCALLVDGKVMCWGNNWCGQFGNGICLKKAYTADKTGFYNIKQISAGGSKTCALTNDGYIECAGSCPGKYGNVSCGIRPEPVKVCE